jgi:hypothetical protein
VSSFTIGNAKNAMTALPAEIAILLRGETGIGKSFIVHQVAKQLNLPVIDRRLSQMTEGDLLGLPSINDSTTTFNPPDWFHQACQAPCVLFLDEMNRATRELQQGAFQLVLDRELNGFKVHPQTRVMAAVNIGGKYAVNEMDAALLRRFFVIDLQPDVNDWLDYAKISDVDPMMIAFIAAHPAMLDPATKAAAGSVQPTRASWERLSTIIKMNNLATSPNDPQYFNLAKGMLGAEVASPLVQFGKNFKFQVTGEDVWLRYAVAKSGIPEKMQALGQEQWMTVLDSVAEYCKQWATLPQELGPNLKLFFHHMPIELRCDAWAKIAMAGSLNTAKPDHAEWAKSIHKFIVHEIVTEVFGVPVGKAGIGVKPQIPKVIADKMNKK